MSTVILKQSTKILLNVQDVFVYFNNSSISDSDQLVINSLLQIVKNKKTDNDIDIKKLLNAVKNLNIQSAIDDVLMRSNHNYSKIQTSEIEAVCNLITSRINVLQMILESMTNKEQ